MRTAPKKASRQRSIILEWLMNNMSTLSYNNNNNTVRQADDEIVNYEPSTKKRKNVQITILEH